MSPNSCLGLPGTDNWKCLPGEFPGYKIILRVPLIERDFLYHSDKGQIVRYAGPVDSP